MSQIVSLDSESSLVTVTFLEKKLPLVRLHFHSTFGDSCGGRCWLSLSTQISEIKIKGGRKMVAVTRSGILMKKLKQVGLSFGVFLGMLPNTVAFAEFSKEDKRIEAFFWKSTTDPWLGERFNFKISYFGRLLNQVCLYPLNRSIGAVVVYQVGDVVKSEVRQLEVSCPFDGPPKSAFHFDYRYELSENDSLFFELLKAKESGVPVEIELAFVDAYGNWDSREGDNYHVQLRP